MQARQEALGENHHRFASDWNCGGERKRRPQPVWLQRCCRSAQKAGVVVLLPAHGAARPPGEGSHPRTPPFSNLLSAEGQGRREEEALPSDVSDSATWLGPSPPALPSRAATRGGQPPPGTTSQPALRVLCTPRTQTSRLGPRALAAPGKAAGPERPPPSRPFQPLTRSPAASSGLKGAGRLPAPPASRAVDGQPAPRPAPPPRPGRAPALLAAPPRLRAALLTPAPRPGARGSAPTLAASCPAPPRPGGGAPGPARRRGQWARPAYLAFSGTLNRGGRWW